MAHIKEAQGERRIRGNMHNMLELNWTRICSRVRLKRGGWSVYKNGISQVEASIRRIRESCGLSARGIPLQAWTEGTMTNIAMKWGEYLTSDDDTLKMENIDKLSLVLL